jgi:heat shock protein HspQ
MKVGDLVRHDQGYIGIITCVDPEQIGDEDEVEVHWNDGDVCNMSTYDLEVICKSEI